MFIKRVLSLGVIAVPLLSIVARGQDPVPLYPRNYTVLVENDRVRVMDFRLRKGDTERFHSHPAHVLYVLEPFEIRFKLPGGRTAMRQAKAGDVLFSEAVTHSPTNIGATDAHGILVELKTPAAAQAVQQALTAVTFIRGKPGTEDQVKRELLTLTPPTRAESGNLRYDLYQSVDRPGQFMRIEVWRSAEALELHKASPYLQASFQRRKDQGWQTQITRWTRVPEDLQRTP
jgi:quinol monooxygenase YgiN